MRRLTLSVVLAQVAALLMGPSAHAAMRTLAVAGGVDTVYLTRADTATTRSGRSQLLVRSLDILGTGRGAAVKLDCRSCARRRGRAISITHHGADTSVRHLNVLLRGSLALRVRVLTPSAVARYLELRVRGTKLVVAAAGCLSARGTATPCAEIPELTGAAPSRGADPSGPTSDPASTIPSGPLTTPPISDLPSTPAPVVPGANPRGALLFVNRTSAAAARVIGWAADADAPETPITVTAWLGDSVAGSGKAGHQRGDVGPHGFDFSIDVDESVRTVCIRGTNIGGGVDAQIGECRPVAAFADINADGAIDCTDVNIIKANWNATDAPYSAGDLNADGTVNIFDVSILSSHMPPGTNCP
jgi:hypothetical protein